MLGAVDTAPKPRHEHVVAFYTSDAELTAAIARFIGEGLDDGGTAVMVATPQHRASIRAALNSRPAPDPSHYVKSDATRPSVRP